MSPSNTNRFSIGLLLLLLSLVSSSAHGQDEPTSETRERLVAAFELTKAQVTDENLGAILDVCEEALTEELSTDDHRYARLLASWAYTKRAELQLDVETTDETLDPTVMSDLDRAVEYDSNNWRARMLRGIAHGLQKHYDRAIADLDSAIRLNDRSANAWYNRAEIRYQVGDFVLATFDYSKALSFSPRDVQAYVGRGHSQFQLGKFAEALEDYQKVVLLDSGSAQSLLFRADAHSALGAWEKARDDYQLAVARDSESAEAHRKLAWLLTTCPDQSVANPVQAEALARRAHELSGGDWVSVETLATTLAALEKLPEALELVDTWTESHPEAELPAATALRESLQNRIE